MRIAEFANKCGCNVHTIRHYEDTGVLLPDYVDENSGYRYYLLSQVDDFKKIKRFQSIGFSIKEIKQLISLDDKKAIELLTVRIEQLKEILKKAEQIKKELEVDK